MFVCLIVCLCDCLFVSLILFSVFMFAFVLLIFLFTAFLRLVFVCVLLPYIYIVLSSVVVVLICPVKLIQLEISGLPINSYIIFANKQMEFVKYRYSTKSKLNLRGL